METDTLNKVQDAERINDTRKAELLSTPIEHIDITKFDARPIIDSMGKMSFTSRDLSRATGIYNTMLEDKDCSIILVDRGLDLGRRLHGSLCGAGEVQHGRRDRRHRRLDRRHGFLRSAWPQALPSQ